MKVVNLESALHREPFRPFEIRVDSEVIAVGHPEQAILAEGKSTLIVVDPQDHLHILDVDQISKIRFFPKQFPNPGGKAKSVAPGPTP